MDCKQQTLSKRQLRVGEGLRRAIANVLEYANLHDDNLNPRSITVTEVTINRDLSNATVFITPLSCIDASDLLTKLKNLTPCIRHKVAKLVHLRIVPNLIFVPDNTLYNVSRIEEILHNPKVRNDLITNLCIDDNN
ncbi:MAG: 30S ribosome-binding factor RbfA [Rhodospirillaceae bacterium]|jgi:ribosome-binding factor A|nr:30S ribosome-binding factor RbfA [Rhodospirillaceae bacterium]